MKGCYAKAQASVSSPHITQLVFQITKSLRKYSNYSFLTYQKNTQIRHSLHYLKLIKMIIELTYIKDKKAGYHNHGRGVGVPESGKFCCLSMLVSSLVVLQWCNNRFLEDAVCKLKSRSLRIGRRQLTFLCIVVQQGSPALKRCFCIVGCLFWTNYV